MVKTLKLFIVTVFFVQSAVTKAFCEGNLGTASAPQEITQSTDIRKSIRQKEQNGLDLARQALEIADSYDDLKESVKTKQDEILGLTKRKTALQAMLQRTRAELNKKTSEFKNNPKMLELTKYLYTRKMNEMKMELAEIEKNLPTLNMEL